MAELSWDSDIMTIINEDGSIERLIQGNSPITDELVGVSDVLEELEFDSIIP